MFSCVIALKGQHREHLGLKGKDLFLFSKLKIRLSGLKVKGEITLLFSNDKFNCLRQN